MGTEPLERKLTAILYADVAGYSRLTGVDEEGTHRRLIDYLDALTATIRKHNGKVLHYAGDAVLADFATVSDALIGAASIQQDLEQRNQDLPDERKIQFRIGVNLGEVIVDRNEIYGDGVNVAARLEGFAEPGGICLSGTVYDAVGTKLPFDYEFLGEQPVKNIDKPIRAYQVRLKPGAVLPEPSARPRARWPMRHVIAATAATVVLIIGAGVIVWWQPWQIRDESASVARMAFPLPDAPSIAVLPFSNLSGDPGQEYFSDGITDDLITDLSKISGLFVIARNSTFAYKGKFPDVRRVSRELGVKYVLEGSVRRAGNQLRINAQLIDGTTGGHVWAERYDGSFADVFALQDEVTQKIVIALAVNLTTEERAAQARIETTNPKAYDAFLRGWAHYRHNTPDDFAKAVPYLEKAIELDANYSRAYAALAAVYWSVVDKDRSSGTTTWSRALAINTDESRRREYLNLQEAMKGPTALAHRVAAGRLSRQGQHDAAITEAGRAIALDPNDPVAYEAMATALIYAGRPIEAAKQIKQAMRFDPRFPREYLYWLGLAQFGMDRFSHAAETLTKATLSNPDDDRSLILLAATFGHLGKVQEAKAAVEKADTLRQERQRRLIDPNLQLGIDVLLAGPYTLKDAELWPFQQPADRERLYKGLQLAGVPEAGQGEDVSPMKVAGATTVNATTAKSLLDRGALFVDVRGDESWNNGHIPGAVHLYLKTNFDETTLSAVADKDQEVVIYCMGPRCLLSSKACAKAVSWGFEKVYYFREGLPSWRAAGYPIEVPKG